MESTIDLDKKSPTGSVSTVALSSPLFHEKIIYLLFFIAGLLLNISTWYHPVFLVPVIIFILGLLPLFLLVALHRPFYLLLFILLILFTQYTFPNNVTYETYYGYEKPTIFFHSFAGILSVFDIVLLSSLYVLTLRGLMVRKFGILFSNRWESYAIYGITLWALFNGLYRQNVPKEILSEIQGIVYAGILYVLVSQTISDKSSLKRAVYFVAILLSITIPIEFIHYQWVNYHRLIYAVGRIVRPLLNSISDNVMVLPAFIFLSCATAPHWTTKKIWKIGAALGAAVALLVIYLNTGRELALLTSFGLVVFLLIRRFHFKVYLSFTFILIIFFLVLELLSPYHVQRLNENFQSVWNIITDYRKDSSIWDRIAEFQNVAVTLNREHAPWMGLGWGGKWDEYYFQPGRGSLAAYSDKTLTRHRLTHNILSQLFVKAGYLGTAILFLAAFSLFWHFVQVYRKLKDPEIKPLMLGLLIIYPIFCFFSSILQICIALGMVIGFLRRVEILEQESSLTDPSKQGK